MIETPAKHIYVQKLLGFDFDIEYKPGCANNVSEALSRVHEEESEVQAAFMALYKSTLNLSYKLRKKCTILSDLRLIVTHLQEGKNVAGYFFKDDIIIFNSRYCLGKDSKLKTCY